MSSQVIKFAALGALVVGSLAAFACSSSEPKDEPVAPAITDNIAPSAATAPGARRVGQFVGRFDHTTHEFKISPVGRPIQLSDDLEPLSADQLVDDQYVLADGGGSPNANTVDLVTTGTSDPYPTSHTFTANVTLRSFYTRSLANVYVYISSVQFPSGTPISGYDSENSDGTNGITAALGINAAHGMWSYNNGSANGPFLSANPTLNTGAGNWAASRTWIFNNTADQNIIYNIQVFASKGYSNYTFGFGSATYTPVCPAAGGTGTAQGVTSAAITLPFDFTLYNTNTTSWIIARNGQLVPSSQTPEASGTSVKLPNVGEPAPVFFAFWDKLGKNTNPTAQMCTTTTGSAPSRKYIIEWYNMDFTDAADQGAHLDFEAILSEGSNQIDTVYNSMIGAAGEAHPLRETGTLSTVGMQGERQADGGVPTAFTQEHHNSHGDTYGTGDKWSYFPNP